jgi:hypothetical protein
MLGSCLKKLDVGQKCCTGAFLPVALVLRGSLGSGMTQCGVMPNAPERKRPVKLPSATASVAEVSLTSLQASDQ